VRYLSLFSGIEAASVAWSPLGWEPVAFAEIEPFACAVLAHHYPTVPNLGDVTRINGKDFHGRVDLVVGGFPCQDVSVAGKRKGLADGEGNATRSGLFFDALRVADDSGARWLVIENVPGLFSNRAGKDFALVVGAMAGVQVGVPAGGWRNTGILLGPKGLVEWCVLDAQWFGVPQRRRRVFLVRDSRDWASRPLVLFERASLSWNSPPSREARERVAPCVEGRAGRGGAGDFATSGALIDERTDISPTLRARANSPHRADSMAYIPVVSPAIQSRDHKGVSSDVLSDGAPIITHSLNAAHAASEDGTGRGVPLVTAPLVAMQESQSGVREYGTSGSLRANAPGHNSVGTLVRSGISVRRLTPKECERLMGLRDDYTLVPYRGKPAADSPRYRAIGNSMAVPVMEWIGRRIASVHVL